MKISIILLICFLLLTAFGCFLGRTYWGLYEGSTVEGWERKSRSNHYFYVPPTARGHGYTDYFQFYSWKENEIFMGASFPNRSLCIDGKEVIMVRNDGKSPLVFPIQFSPFGLSIHFYNFDSKDLTIEFPPIILDGKQMPPLLIRFKWSDRKYRRFDLL